MRTSAHGRIQMQLASENARFAELTRPSSPPTFAIMALG